MKIGILGATGYTGQELLRILHQHPEATIAYLGSSSSAGKNFEEIYPHWNGKNYVLSKEEVPDVDVLFTAMPHGITAERAESFLQRGIKLIDLGADFRLIHQQEYESWYKVQHTSPHLLQDAVYGLPELYRHEINGKNLIANPGCYPTASLLALVPLLERRLIKHDSIIIDAKSGVSGAGRGIAQECHFTEVNENFKAYKIGEHRHTPEIEQQLSKAAKEKVSVSFTPHLVPMSRGILATIYAKVKEGVREEDLRNSLAEAYENEVFVHVLPEGTWPQTKSASGSNHAFLQVKLDRRTGRALIVSVIDNLVKGASGQAVQNMNILFNLPETMGLGMTGIWP